MGVRGSGEGKCEGKKTTLTLTLTPFITVCQPVTAKSEGVRVKNKKNFFNRTDQIVLFCRLNLILLIFITIPDSLMIESMRT